MGNDIEVILGALPVNSILRIQDKAISENYQTWRISSVTVTVASYVTYGVSLVTSTHSISNNDPILLIVQSPGTTGPTGITGTTGSNGLGLIAATTYTGLPGATAAGAGARSFITDSTVVASGNFGAVINIGGGSNKVPVYSDGASWRIG